MLDFHGARPGFELGPPKADMNPDIVIPYIKYGYCLYLLLIFRSRTVTTSAANSSKLAPKWLH